jgi:hypothetical protein
VSRAHPGPPTCCPIRAAGARAPTDAWARHAATAGHKHPSSVSSLPSGATPHREETGPSKTKPTQALPLLTLRGDSGRRRRDDAAKAEAGQSPGKAAQGPIPRRRRLHHRGNQWRYLLGFPSPPAYPAASSRPHGDGASFPMNYPAASSDTLRHALAAHCGVPIGSAAADGNWGFC